MPVNTNLAVSHYLCRADMTLPQFLDAIVSAGINSIGVTVRTLNEVPVSKLRQELHTRGLGVSSVNTAGYFFEPWDAGTDQKTLNLRLLDAAAELGSANGVNLIVGGSADMALHEARQIAFDMSARLNEQAIARGTRLMLEPMHPLQARGKGCVNTSRQAAQWLGTIPGLTMNIDLFHSWWDPDLDAALSGEFGELAVIQICDVVIDPETNLPRRAPLGEGFVDWVSLCKKVMNTFPSAPIELEWFADQTSGRDALALMRSDAQKMQTLRGERE